MATRDDLTLGESWRRLVDLGYAPTSAICPDRVTNRFAPTRRDSLIALSDHPPAVMAYPTVANGSPVEDNEQRGVVLLTLTAYLLADSKQAKAIASVLSDYGLMSGPCRVSDFGNRVHVLRWNGRPIFDGEAGARLCFDADDATVFLEHAIAPDRFEMRMDPWGGQRRTAVGAVGSHIIELSGEWKGGDLLTVPRDRLPELLEADVGRLISDIETARWNGRPAAHGQAAA